MGCQNALDSFQSFWVMKSICDLEWREPALCDLSCSFYLSLSSCWANSSSASKVLQVTSRHKISADTLLNCKGYEHSLPLCTVRRNWPDRMKTLEQPLFPGYLFYRIHKSAFAPILRTPGVIQIISFGGKPCPLPVPDYEIKQLRQAVRCRWNKCCVPFLAVGTYSAA